MDQSSLKLVAQHFVKEEYKDYIQTWLNNASKNEIKGVKVIQAVIKNHGKKKFRPRTENPNKSFRLDPSYLRRTYMKSAYNSSFCAEAENYISESKVLRHKKLHELHFSKILTKQALFFLERWIELKDSPHYLDCMMACLRGIYSVVKIQKGITDPLQRESYRWFTVQEMEKAFASKRNNPRPVPVDTGNHRAQSQPAMQRCLETSFEKSNSKEKRQTMLRGCGNLTGWNTFYEPKVTSYQNSFATQQNKSTRDSIPDYKTSTVMRVLPSLS